MNTAYNSLGATAVYGDGTVSSCSDGAEGFDACNDSLSLSAYGRLYNWYAVDDARGLCPSGWQVPTVSEWTVLEDYISSQGFDGMVGAVLKSTSGWYNNGNGTNDFGFSALPCGTLHSNFFSGAGERAHWWSSSPNDDGTTWAYIRYLMGDDSDMSSDYANRQTGNAVRCLRVSD